MGSNPVVLMSQDEALGSTCDSRIAALRFDALPWDLVLDMDVSMTEAKDPPIRRVWLVFSAVDEITWPSKKTRVPVGYIAVSGIEVAPAGEFFEYAFDILSPTYEGGIQVGSSTKTVVVTARALIGLASRRAITFGGESELPWKERTDLARDEDFIHFFEGLAPAK